MKISIVIRVICGFIALLLGLVGVLIPVWPTTPFVMLAIGCFSATPKIQKWLLRIRFFREYYESYTLGYGLRYTTTAMSLVFLWGMLMLSGVMVPSWFMRCFLFGVGIAVSIHILWVSRKRKIRN